MLFQPVYPAANDATATSACDPRDFFSAKDVMVNGTSILGRSEEEGRGRYCSFVKHLRPKSAVGGYTPASENNGLTIITESKLTSIDVNGGQYTNVLELYNNMGGRSTLGVNTDVSVGPFYRN